MSIVLAPMEGILDAPMREILTAVGGIDACVSEFVRVTDSRLPRRVFRRYVPEIFQGAQTSSQIPVAVQLLGSSPEWMAASALHAVHWGAQSIDINFGCPAKIVNQNGGGASLLKTPALIHDICQTIRKTLPSHIPLTAKMRLGYSDTTQTFECVDALTSAGIAELTVHARTKEEGYRPPAHWEWIAKIREAIDIPVIANGEVWTVQDYINIQKISGCEKVMIGRGMIASPDLGLRIKHYENTGDMLELMPWSAILPLLNQLFDRCVIEADGATGYPISRIKQWIKLLKPNYPEAHGLFEQIRPLKAIDPIEKILKQTTS